MTQDSIHNFLATIEADRDQKIEKIRSETDAEIAQILGDAHQRSRRLQRDTNKRLRSELSNRRKKETSRIQARLKRQLWQSLTHLQSDIKIQVLDQLKSAWSNAEWQCGWCEFWLQHTIEGEDNRAFRVEIDRSVLPETLDFIRRWAEQRALQVELVDSLKEAGLIIYWQDFELDGRLAALEHTIDEEVLAKLAPMMPQLQQVESL